MIRKSIDKFHAKTGKILSKALHIETQLDFFIENYFVNPQTQKTFFFSDVILLKLNFEQKIIIFKEICRKENFDEKKLLEIVKSIKYVQETRNKVAHWQSEKPNNKQIQLRARKTHTTEKDVLILNENLFEKIEEERLKAINGITEFYLKYSKEGTFDIRNDSSSII